jgi:N-acetylneuraminate synthase
MLVGKGHPVFVIAEIGINHNGEVSLAKKLIDAAIDAGCNAVKFQKRTVPVVYTEAELAKPREVPPHIISTAISRRVLSPEAVKRLVESNLTNTTNGDLKWALEFTAEEYKEIDTYCKEKGIMWFASPWDEDSVDFLDQFDPPAYKIASASLTDANLLKHVRRGSLSSYQPDFPPWGRL